MNLICTFTITALTAFSALVTCLPVDDAMAVCGSQYPGGTLCGNSGTTLNVPNTTAAPVLGVPGITQGSLDFAGSGSGQVHVVPQAAAGTPTITWPTVSGTVPTTASTPITLNVLTGAIGCATCLTGGGGPLTVTLPLAITGSNIALGYDANFSLVTTNLAFATGGIAYPSTVTGGALGAGIINAIDLAIGGVYVSTPNHSIPVGGGGGTGFKSVGPCNAGYVPMWGSSSTDPVCSLPQILGPIRKIIASGAITVDATTDYIINVQKTVEASTVVSFPTVAARIATGGSPIFVKNYMSNGALYYLLPTPSGSETIELIAGPYTMDGQNEGLWFYPDGTVTPNNWEIR